MEIKRIGTQPSGKGPADWFTGDVYIDAGAAPEATSKLRRGARAQRVFDRAVDVELMTSGETRTTTLRLEPRAAKGSA